MLFRRPTQRTFAPEQLDQRLRAGLVVHWIGGATGANWFDQSGYGRHGVITNATPGLTWRNNRDNSGAAVWTDGTADSIDSPLDALGTLSTSAWSFGGWFTWESVAGTACLMSLGRPGATSFAISITNRSGGSIRLENGGPATLANSGVTPVAFQWYHVFATFIGSGTAPRLYVNGVETVGSGTPLTSAPQFVCVGRYRASSYFDSRAGLSNDIRVYNRSLSSAEVSVLASPSFSPVIQSPRWWLKRQSTGNRRRRVICAGAS